MSVLAPDTLLTIDEFYALVGSRDETERWELVRGIPVMSPSESTPNIEATLRLTHVMFHELPESTWQVLAHADVRLSGGARPTVRTPDATLARRTGTGGNYVDARHVALVAEAVSPTSVERDLITKRHEYATAGIPNYLIINPRSPGSPLTLLTTPATGDYTESVSGRSITLTVDTHQVAITATDLRIT